MVDRILDDPSFFNDTHDDIQQAFEDFTVDHNLRNLDLSIQELPPAGDAHDESGMVNLESVV
jgi:hypothetical protein